MDYAAVGALAHAMETQMARGATGMTHAWAPGQETSP
jgi:hypothetical protein